MIPSVFVNMQLKIVYSIHIHFKDVFNGTGPLTLSTSNVLEPGILRYS